MNGTYSKGINLQNSIRYFYSLNFYTESTKVKDDSLKVVLETVEQSKTENAERPFHSRPYRARYTQGSNFLVM